MFSSLFSRRSSPRGRRTRNHSASERAREETAPAEYPEALPSRFEGRYTDPVDGVAFIDAGFPIHEYPIELVVTSAVPTATSDCCPGGPSQSVHAASDGEALHEVPAIYVSDTSAKDLLRSGGCIIVSDEFSASNPNSPVASAAMAFPSERTGTTPTTAVPPSLTNAGEAVQQLLRVRGYLAEAAEQHRPLFRRRSSSLVFGRAEYQSPTTAQPPD